MNRGHLWKLLFILFVVAWALTELYPPTARNLVEQFADMATMNQDDALKGIIQRARELEKKNPNATYENLLTAVGTNSLVKYFPTNFVSISVLRSTNVTRQILNRVQREAAGQIKLGIDLQGGAQVLMEMNLSQKETNRLMSSFERTALVEHAVEVLRRRVDRFGVAEPILQPAGDNRIVVQLPGIPDNQVEEAVSTLKKAAFLEFRMVHKDGANLLRTGIVPPGYELKVFRRVDSTTGTERNDPVIVKKTGEKEFKGEYITRAGVARDPYTGAPEIHFELNKEGARIFAEITAANVGQSFATLLDGEVISVANIREPIPGGNVRISGGFSDKEAFDLANNLENPMKVPLQVVSSGSVGASLGQDAVRGGIRAGIYGTVAVAGFMLVYYMLAGAVANVALILNILLLLGFMCSIDVTLTLPGIAGIVLTIGMAVDANVLIYERMREELAAGKSVRGAVAAGYDKAFGTILDSNLTTLISSVLLIVLGTGTIKGFGTALTIGLIVSMFTALVVTRLIFDFLLAKGWLKSLPMLHIVKGAHFDFMQLAKPAFALSWLIIIIGCLYGIAGRGKQMLGTDFAGGDSLVLSFSKAPALDQVRARITEMKVGEPTVQLTTEGPERRQLLRIVTQYDSGARVEQELTKAFPDVGFKRASLEQVGPIVGREIMRSAILATILSLFGILVYVAFRYEFSFAVGAVVAVIHDVLMTIGIYCLTGLTGGEGRQFNGTFVAAILTIVGFSINDTIVIFDRIREDLKLGVRGTFREMMNHALNQTLSRTIITSGTVLLATLSLYLFGGGGVNDFAFTFLVGIITGTYSSIYIASALVLWWHKGQRPTLGGATATVITGGASPEATGA